jgi:PAS domain S-box-containing protein
MQILRGAKCWAGYGIAIIAVGVSVLIRWLLDPLIGYHLELVTLFGAVAATVCFGGWRPALLAAVVGYFAAHYLFVPPRYEILFDLEVFTGLAAYSLSCGIIIYVGQRMLGARQSVEKEIVERKSAEQAIRGRDQQLQTITDAVPALISYIDRERRYRFVNREYERWFGHPRGAVVGKTMIEVLGEVAVERLRPYVDKALGGHEARFELETPYRDGGTRWIDAHYVPDRGASGEVAGFFVLVRDISERKRTEGALANAVRQQEVLYHFLERQHRAASLAEIYEASLEAILSALGCERASILLLDDSAIMRFVAWRGLSEEYRRAVDGHSAWSPDDPNPQVVCVHDIATANLDESLKATVTHEGIGALAFIPLVIDGKLAGKFMIYYDQRHVFTDEEIELALTMARQIALGIEQHRADDALRRSEERYRAVVESQAEMVCRFRPDGTILFVNGAYARARGMTPELLIGGDFWEFIDEQDRPAVQAMLDRLAPQLPEVRIENRFETIEGVRWTLWTNRALSFDAAGRWSEAQSAGIDITERKRAEEALREREERYELVAAGAEAAIWDWDVPGKRVVFSPRWKELRGFADDEVSDREEEWSGGIHPDDLERVMAAVQAHFDGRTAVFAEEYRVRHKDGRWIWILDRGIARRDAAGRVSRMAGSETDITGRKRAEAALRQSEQRFRSIFEGIGLSIWEEDFSAVKAEIDQLAAAGVSDFRRYFAEHPESVDRAIDLVKIRDVNPATVEMFCAASRAELLQSLQKIFVPESKTVFVEELVAIAEKKRSFESETVVQTLRGERLNVSFTITFPPSDQSFDRVLVTVADITERKGAEDILRQSEERFRLMANNCQIVIWLTDAAGKLRFVNRAFLDLFGISRDQADEFDWIGALHPEDRNSYVTTFRTALRNHDPFQQRVRVRRFDGRWRWFESRVNPVADSNGMIGYIGSSLDITDIYESQQVLKELDQRKDEFLANMSHEIRSPLTGIMGYADILLSQIKDPEQVRYLKTIKESGDYLIEIVNDILDLSKIDAGKLVLNMEPVSPHELLGEIHGLMDVRAREKQLPLALRYDGVVPPSIRTERTRLRQIVINLVSNAIKFTEEGRVEIVARFFKEPGLLQIEVIDTGIGIAPEHQQILFQPFTQADTSSTRQYGGTGLGLTITKRLAEMLGGTISFESELGKGSTFRVIIPTAAAQTAAATPAPVSAALPVGPELPLQGHRVLVVDDREEFCYLVSRYIEEAGGRPTAVTDGQAAIAAVEAAAKTEAFHAVIMDIQMPGIDGYETTRAIRAQGFQTPIIALTAGAMVGDREKCLKAGCDDYLTKPIDRRALVGTVARYVEKTSSRLSGKREVLVVDDSHSACELMSRFLAKRGHEVRSAHDGHSALSLAQEFRPNVVVVDIRLPDMNGYELLRRLKESGALQRGAKLIAVSGYRDDDADARRTLEFDHFLEKPLNLEELNALLHPAPDMLGNFDQTLEN